MIILRSLRYFSKLNALKEKERLKQKEAEHRELYAINLVNSSKGPNYSSPFFDLLPLS